MRSWPLTLRRARRSGPSQLDDYKTGCYSTLAPLAVRGKIILGYSGGELGVRGSVNAFDAATGKRIWKTYTVPAPNEPGGDSWKGDTYKRGGGSTWITGVYEPATNTTYWGTGNPGPWVADDRPGDNLYTDSTLALDADTGKIKSYHQYTPHDSWDWDEVSAPLLIDTEVDGKLTKTATHAGRNGYLWILDRDRLNFLHAFPFSNNNVFTSIDQKTGRPTVDESKRPGAQQGAEFCPSIGGGKDWPPEAWSPQTKLLYVPANNNICAFLPKGEVPERDAKGIYVGYQVEEHFRISPRRPWRVRSRRRTASLGPEHRQARLAAQFQDDALVTAAGHGRGHPLRRRDSGSPVQGV